MPAAVVVGAVAYTKPTLLCCQHARSRPTGPLHSISLEYCFHFGLKQQNHTQWPLPALPHRNSVSCTPLERCFRRKPSSLSLMPLLLRRGGKSAHNAIIESSSSTIRGLGLLSGILTLALGRGGGPALAAANEVQNSEGGGDATDLVLTILFGAAFVGLVILSVGVLYLSVSDFLEKRQITEQQKALGEEKLDLAETAKIGSPKGFGSKKVPDKKAEKSK